MTCVKLVHAYSGAATSKERQRIRALTQIARWDTHVSIRRKRMSSALEDERIMMNTTKRTVLISGAGIAGPTLTYWLTRSGFAPTVIERAPHLREGGYPV